MHSHQEFRSVVDALMREHSENPSLFFCLAVEAAYGKYQPDQLPGLFASDAWRLMVARYFSLLPRPSVSFDRVVYVRMPKRIHADLASASRQSGRRVQGVALDSLVTDMVAEWMRFRRCQAGPPARTGDNLLPWTPNTPEQEGA